ncbi:MAG: hypothetical protein ABIK89_18090 [Planctomycetota bacterium]
MKRRTCVILSVLWLTTPFAATAATLDLGTAKLGVDAEGYVTRLELADGTAWPSSGQPALWLETDEGRLFPESVVLSGDKLVVVFEGGSRAEFQVSRHRGFAIFDLTAFTTSAKVERFRLFSLATPPDASSLGALNGALWGSSVLAVMAAEPNVRAFGSRLGHHQSDRAGCRHEFVQIDEAKAGQHAARFTATSDQKPGGWSMRGKILPRPLDLSGCRAIRAWVRGDGKGEQLKIQLFDGRGGYRDNYLTIDFEGWRQVTLADTAINSVRYDRVTTLNVYYNGLPPSEAVTCDVDQIEAVLQRDGAEEIVVLEDFESRESPWWSPGAATLDVETYDKYGIEPARFGLIACPQAELTETIERFELAAGMPSPRPSGVWNKRSPWVDRSYFFLTGFGETQFDEALAIAQRGGFHTILIGQGSWCQTTGHYEVNRNNFPDGVEGLKRTVQKFKEAGFRVGLHFLGASIYSPDPYLTPVPDPRLVKDAFTTLAADVDAAADFLPTPSAPTGFPEEDGSYLGDGTVLQIGDELIRYGERAMEPPLGFRKCQRGYLGTQAAAHKKDDPVAHLARSYGYHMFDMDTSLLDEVAANFAKVANACEVDMLYFDGSERLQGDHWYYNARLHKAFYDKLDNKDMLLQASSFSHYSWHMLARSASADGHGDLKGYLDERSSWFDSLARGGMPLDIGWYYGYDTAATLDMYEYVLGATIGYDSSMSFQVSPSAAAKHPFTGEILNLIARYEKLRLSGRVDDEMKARLRIDPVLGGQKEPEERDRLLDHRREYRLLGPEGQEAFQRVVYGRWHEVTGADGANNVWPVSVNEGPARVGVQVQAQAGPWLKPGPAYSAEDALALETFDDLAPYAGNPNAASDVRVLEPGEAGSVLDGVTQHVELRDDDAREGPRYAVYTATSTLPAVGGWSVIQKRFDPPLDLSRHKGIGFWLRGDGRGGAFKLQLRDDKGATDYYVQNDFVGWRYQQLARPASDPIDYSKVSYLAFYYNSLPAETAIACGIDDVKALGRLDTRAIVDPYVEVAGRRIGWKGSLSEGQYLVLWPEESATRYGLPLKQPEVSPEKPPLVVLPSGEHSATFGCSGGPNMPVRVRVTLQPPERYEVP